MLIVDLLRHTSGLTYGAPGANQLKQSYLDMKVNDRGQTTAEPFGTERRARCWARCF